MSERIRQIRAGVKKQHSTKRQQDTSSHNGLHSPHAHILHLQRTIGNHALQRLLAQHAHDTDTIQRFPLVLTERRRIASGSKDLGPGIKISWTNSNVKITANMEIFGAEANATIASQMQSTINGMWNKSFSDGFSVSCNASVTFRNATTDADSSKTQISAYRGGSPSSVSREWLIGSRYMSYNLNSNINWTPAHEFGHLLGLDDRYSEGILSQIAGTFGGKRESVIEEGWAGNIMAEHGGVVEGKNVRDLLGLHAYENVIIGTPESAQPEMA